jgi:hypothetical protein
VGNVNSMLGVAAVFSGLLMGTLRRQGIGNNISTPVVAWVQPPHEVVRRI